MPGCMVSMILDPPPEGTPPGARPRYFFSSRQGSRGALFDTSFGEIDLRRSNPQKSEPEKVSRIDVGSPKSTDSGGGPPPFRPFLAPPRVTRGGGSFWALWGIANLTEYELSPCGQTGHSLLLGGGPFGPFGASQISQSTN